MSHNKLEIKCALAVCVPLGIHHHHPHSETRLGRDPGESHPPADTGRVGGLIGFSRKCRGFGSGAELEGERERERIWEDLKLEQAGFGRPRGRLL